MMLYSLMALAAVFGALAAASAIAAARIERDFPPQGSFITVDGTKLRVLDLGASPFNASEPAIVLIHGASAKIEDMRIGLGDRLAQRHRVILIDRPGHGWSDRKPGDNQSSPGRQAELMIGVLKQLGVTRSVVVAHSLGGAVAPAMALAAPETIAGLVLLAPVTHPWPGGIAWHYTFAKIPLIGELFAYTLAWPMGSLLLDAGVQAAFAPQAAPPDYAVRAGAAMVLRPKSFLANARDVAGLLEFVTSQVPRYPQIKAPTVIISGTSDKIVSIDIHSRAFARALPHARLIVLDDVGHMPHYAESDKVVAEIEQLIGGAPSPSAKAVEGAK